MASKTYISLKVLELHTMVTVKGRTILIPFIGGTRGPVRRNGIYVTSDEAIQNALENAPGFGERFGILQSRKPISKVPMVVREVDNVVPEDVDEVDDGIKQVPGITSAQKAKEWFIDNYPDVTASELSNKAKILDVASKYKVKFVDWV